MPWTSRDAQKKTHRAKSAKSKRMWSHVANSMLKRGESERAAVRAANGVVKKAGKRKKTRRSSR